MKRRDYLKQMAVGVGGIAVSRMNLLARGTDVEKASTRVQTMVVPQERFLGWPKADRPQTTSVLIELHGLLDFYYNGESVAADKRRTCGIGFHSAKSHHRPMIDVFEDETSIWPEARMMLPKKARVDVGIHNGSAFERSQVGFLMNEGADDFRWLVDMNALGWYPNTVAEGKYAARLFVRHGTFFTMSRTCRELVQAIQLQGSYTPGPAPVSYPAEIIGSEISLGAGQHVRITVTGFPPFRVPTNPAKTYRIVFTNMCHEEDDECMFKWNDPNEERRNDFHYHRKTLKLQGGPKASVALKSPPTQACPTKTNTNEAPCMGAGYGGGPGPA